MRIMTILISVTIVAIMIASAVSAHAEIYGERIAEKNATSIGDIVANPKNYDGKTVLVKGKISAECPTGCWFNIEEKGAVLYVDINPSGFAIPQKVGHKASIEGTIQIEDDRTVLVGKGVEVR